MEPIRRLRAYPDTSVFGGAFDAAFATLSAGFWRALTQGRFDVLLSDLTIEEQRSAGRPSARPGGAQPECGLAFLRIVVEELADVYLGRGVLPASMANDAAHVAVATVGGADILTSWNFKHLVNVRRIRLFQAVNIEMGFPTLDIRNPAEVVPNE